MPRWQATSAERPTCRFDRTGTARTGATGRGDRRRGRGSTRRLRALGSQYGGASCSARHGELGGGTRDPMVTGKCTGDELRRRHRFGLRRIGEPEGEGEEGVVQEDRELTLSARVCSAVAEEG